MEISSLIFCITSFGCLNLILLKLKEFCSGSTGASLLRCLRELVACLELRCVETNVPAAARELRFVRQDIANTRARESSV
jgi:hypothetical protein